MISKGCALIFPKSYGPGSGRVALRLINYQNLTNYTFYLNPKYVTV
jgi:hypothetical protein